MTFDIASVYGYQRSKGDKVLTTFDQASVYGYQDQRGLKF
jgi:hypothetical protein